MIGNAIELITYLYNQDKDKLFELKEKKNKRTLTQNGYAWALITQLANIMRMDKEEMYLQCLEHYGQREVISMLSSINPVGYFKYYKKVGTGIINGKEFTHYAIFKGSSEFDTKEMAIFLDGIIQECENVGIPTLTRNEIERLKLNG